MAVTTTLIKNDRQRAVIHMIADTPSSTASVTLLSLRKSDEIATSTTSQLAVSIAAAYVNLTDAASGVVIRRGTSSGVVVLDMHAQSEYPMSNMYPAIAVSSTADIYVSFQVPGMVVLDVRKIGGYAGPDTNVGV